MKKSILLILSMFIFTNLFCQNEENTDASDETGLIDVSADFMSRYIWRGLDCGGESPSIQPSLSFNFGDSNHAFSIGTWAAYNFNTAAQEIDLFLNYTFRDAFSVIFTDYYYPGNTDYTPEQQRFFSYKQDSTGHLIEGCLSFNGTEKIPFSLLFAMNLYGYDAHKINADSSTGDIVRSKYIEIGYNRNIKGIDFSAFIGAALDNPDESKGEEGYYLNESVGLINVGIKAVKTLKISKKFELPIQSSLIVNPQAEKVYLVFGISL